MAKLTKLDDRHRAACRMRVEGRPNTEIAKALGVREKTLHIWFSNPLVKDYLQSLAANVEQEFAVQLAQGGMIAVRELVELVQKPDRDSDLSSDQKVRVAQEILDRLPGTTRVRERRQAPTSDTYNQLFLNMGDGELARVLKRWAELGVLDEGSGTGTLEAGGT